ncbi:MAG: cell division protein ZapA [Balneolales bacterium]|nr:cell division protein ZapA [Balneolales bacterium]
MKSIKVTILGRQYPLKVQDGDEEAMYDIARFVDERFRLFKKQFASQSEATILVLGSLSIAEELFQARKNNSEENVMVQSLLFDETKSLLKNLLREINHTN